ncbi:hypothetical protein [Nonomuraea ceibae]|uniref:hypothetical protein n=1 Tax=Nonomuraea ceibae TaxID=1935170 RepID=UPI001C5F0329|nr:hypothetical protein [Nonomuraea ceibae]
MLTYDQGENARRAGLDLIISLTPDQAAALGADAAELLEAVDTLLVGLAALRSGRSPEIPEGAGLSLKDQPIEADTAWTEWLIRDLETLRQRVSGATAAAIRAHADQGGSYGELATAMGVSRATAQRRRDSITRTAPKKPEQWAITYPDRKETR